MHNDPAKDRIYATVCYELMPNFFNLKSCSSYFMWQMLQTSIGLDDFFQ